MSVNPGATLTKDPDAELMYAFDWSNWLVSPAQIASSSWTITPPAGELVSALTSDNETDNGTSTFARLLGGTLGKTYTITNEVVTNETPPQMDNRSFRLRIQQQ